MGITLGDSDREGLQASLGTSYSKPLVEEIKLKPMFSIDLSLDGREEYLQ